MVQHGTVKLNKSIINKDYFVTLKKNLPVEY